MLREVPALPRLSDTASESAVGAVAALLLAGFGRWLAPGASSFAGERSRSPCALPARSREVGVATEILLTKAEQVSDDRRALLVYA